MKTLTFLLIAICFYEVSNAQSKQHIIDSLENVIHEYEKRSLYFQDMEVIKTVTREKMTLSEIMELIDKQPNVKRVSIPYQPRRFFAIENLAYPQYEYYYTLTKKEWRQLQDYCMEQLGGGGHEDVIAHWKSIVKGKTPFGLRVQK